MCDELIHIRDDMELLRANTVRVLTREIDLLENGLSALSKGYPNVTKDHLERSIDSLRVHLEKLENLRNDI